jgi:hypothetical protein
MAEALVAGEFTHEDAVVARRERDAAVATINIRELHIAELKAALRKAIDLAWTGHGLPDDLRALEAVLSKE